MTDLNESVSTDAVVTASTGPEVATITSEAVLTADLQVRLGDLPRELYDIILEVTIQDFIEAGPRKVRLSAPSDCHDHKLQIGILHLNRATRAQYAKDFYQRLTFTTRLEGPRRSRMHKWAVSVPSEHLAFVRKFKCIWPEDEWSSDVLETEVDAGLPAEIVGSIRHIFPDDYCCG